MMKEWDVYVDGRHIGTVNETSEEYARCAALCKFDIAAESDLSVSRRF